MKGLVYSAHEVQGLNGLRTIHRASTYLRNQFRNEMTRDEAIPHFKAREILFNCSNLILQEFDMGITQAEVEGARIIEKSVSVVPQDSKESE